jgi:hypothetical protein
VQGPLAFYKGFLPNFARLGSWNVIMFLTLEQVAEYIIVILELCKAYYMDYITFFLSAFTGPEGLREEACELKMG